MKSVSLKALRNKDRMDVETAVEIHRKAIQDSIPDKRVSTTLVPELEFKHWKKNGASLLSYPIGLAFSLKHSRLFITNRLLHAVFMVGMHCPANVTLIAGGGEPRHTNGHGNKARFRNPAGIAVKESGKLYVCDQGNGRVRVVNLRTLFCHASRLYKGTPKKAKVRKKIALLYVSVKSMYTIFPLFLKVMYRIWCHHLPYVRLQRIALNCLCQTFVLARFFQFLVL